MKHIINPAYYQDYILAGKPEFLLINTKTQKQDIFKVMKIKWLSVTGKPCWFVNNRLRENLGKIVLAPESTENLYVFEPSTRHMTVFEIDQMHMFTRFWTWMLMGRFSPHIEIRYDGRCAHCQRPLTHPESLPIGIGPDCFKKLGLSHKILIFPGGGHTLSGSL